MKKFLYLFIVLLPYASLAQGELYIAPNAQISTIGQAKITLHNTSLINNGNLELGNSTFYINGSSINSIGGNTTTFFHDLIFQNTLLTHFGQNIKVNHLLELHGALLLDNQQIKLGENGILKNENEQNRLLDQKGNNGFVSTTRNFVEPLYNENPGNIGVEFVYAPELGLTTISRVANAFERNGSTAGLFQRYYMIEPTINENLGASVRFHYLNEELNGVNENTALLWKSNNNGHTWSQLLPDARDTTANWIQKNEINDFSWWSIGNSASALPLILNSFNSYCKGNGTTLVWKTNVDHSSVKYIVEKSKDAVNWEMVANISPGNQQTDYQFHDAEKARLYYRLKEVSATGTFTYSKILVSDCEVKSVKLLLYPNPTTDFVNLEFESQKSFNTNIQIYSIQGLLVDTQKVIVEKGMNKIKLNVMSLRQGTYLARINNLDQNFAKTFVRN